MSDSNRCIDISKFLDEPDCNSQSSSTIRYANVIWRDAVSRIAPAIFVSIFFFLFGSATADELVRVQGVGGLIASQLQGVGNSVAAERALTAERQDKIRALQSALEDCGDCAARDELKTQLEYWTKIDDAVSQAEHAALATTGLGQYKDFGDMFRQLGDALTSPSYLAKLRKRDWEEHLKNLEVQRANTALEIGCREKTREEVKKDGSDTFITNGKEYFVDKKTYFECIKSSVNDAAKISAIDLQDSVAVNFCENLSRFQSKGTWRRTGFL